jgi:hypothetical protein
MNTTLTAPPGRQDHPPQPTAVAYLPRKSRVALLDRVALHLGVALIKWSRRAHYSREHLAMRSEQSRANQQRERGYERTLRLTIPPR